MANKVNKLLLNNKKLEKKNQELTEQFELVLEQNQYLQEQLFALQRQMYGRKKEDTPSIDGQTNLFDTDPFKEPEQTGQESQELIEVKSFRRKKTKGKKALSLANLPANHLHYYLEGEDCLCDACGTHMTEIGSTVVREEPLFIPAHIEKNLFHQHAYKCCTCEKDNGTTSIKKAHVPKPLINNSFGSPTMVAQTIVEKYVKKVPAYRQENEWKTFGFPLDRQKITHWHLLAPDYVLSPLYQLLKETLQNQEIIHADETHYNVLDVPKATTYYWLYTSGKAESYPVVLYQHELSRKHEIPQNFLTHFTGYLHSDAYAAYGKMSGIKNVYCWAHVRRKFHEAVGSQPKKYSTALLGERYCDLLFKEEKKLRHLDPTDRQKQRRQWIKPIVDEFFSWASNLCVLPRSKLGEAVAYLLKYKEGLRTFLEDGRLETTNNRAERAIKELVIGRKNWLFSKSEKGAQATGIILSILRTAVENGLDPRKYLIYLFEHIPNLPSLTKTALAAYLPWNQEVQKDCRANY